MIQPPPVARGPSSFFRRLLPALLVACFVTAIFWWNPFGHVPREAYFETLLRPTVAGAAQLVVNIDGGGLHKGRTLSQSLKADEINRVRFTLPAGRLEAFIFRPLAADGEVEVLQSRFMTESGEVMAMLSPAALVASNGAVRRVGEDAVRLPGRVGEITTGLKFDLQPPIDLGATRPPSAGATFAVFFVTLLATLLLSRVAEKLRWRNWLAVVWRRAHSRPRLALLGVALFSTVVSCFPVVFCGKSFVSPDNGLQLLYEAFPGVPGAQGGRTENPAGSDMGATFYWHQPASIIQHRALFQDGEFPLWNRYNWGGVSLWAQCISMLGDPLHWPAVVSGGAAWAWDFKFIAYKILFAFGVGLLVRASSRHLPAALLLTLSVPWIGFFAYRFCHAGFFALCAAPWILLPWLEAARAPDRRRVALWAAFLILANWWQLNSGTAKETSALLICLNGAGALALLFAALPGRERLVRLGIFAWSNLLFALLSAPLWWCFLDALGKAATSYEAPQVCQIQPGLFAGLFDDIFYRQFMNHEYLLNPSANFFVLLGVAWALVRVRVLAKDGTFLAASLVAMAAAAIAFGVVSPHALALVPMIRNIHHFDNTFSCVLFILLFVIAGYGLRECRRRMRGSEWRGDWALVLGLVALLLAAFFGMTQAAHRGGTTFLAIGDTIPKSDFFWAYCGVLVVALALLPWAWRAARQRGPAAAAWLVVLVACLAALHFRHGMYLVTRFDYYTMNPKQRLDLREVPSPAVAQIKSAMREPARVVGLDWIMTPGFNTTLGLETISGPDALQNPAMRDLAKTLGLPTMWFWRLIIWRKDFAPHHRALDMLGVRYFLDQPGRGTDLPGTKSIGSSDLEVFESPTAWPRAFFTDTVATYRELPELRRLVQEGDGRPFAAMMPIARSRVPLPERDAASRAVVPAHGYRLTQNSTTFEIDAPSPGLAVLGEAWLPGDLEVLVDGRPAEVLRVDHAFRGVFLDQPGRHTVQFRYWPEVLGPALWLALAGLVGLLCSGWLMGRHQSRVARPAAAPAEADLPDCT